MTRPGRKRKSRVNREANGRAQRMPAAERAECIMAVARAAPHRRNVIDMTGRRPKEPDPRDPRLGSEFGRMRLRNLITAEQYAAGLRWARIVIRMRQAIGAPQETPRGVLGALAGTAGSGRDMSPEDAAQARADYADAFHALAARGRHLPKLVWLTVGQDHPCHDLPALRRALDALVGHFEETEKRVCSASS